jgi:hypothetical protein
MVHGAWRDSMTALFKDFVAHETHRLILENLPAQRQTRR